MLANTKLSMNTHCYKFIFKCKALPANLFTPKIK